MRRQLLANLAVGIRHSLTASAQADLDASLTDPLTGLAEFLRRKHGLSSKESAPPLAIRGGVVRKRTFRSFPHLESVRIENFRAIASAQIAFHMPTDEPDSGSWKLFLGENSYYVTEFPANLRGQRCQNSWFKT